MSDEPELQEFADNNLMVVRLVSVAFLVCVSCTAAIASMHQTMKPIDTFIVVTTAITLVLTSIAAKNKRAIAVASHMLVLSLLFFIVAICFLSRGVTMHPIVAIPFIPALCAKLFRPTLCIFYSVLTFLGLIFLLFVRPEGLVQPSLQSYLHVTWLTIVIASTTFISLYIVLHNKALSKTLKYQSERDFLTGLPNRFKIHEHLFKEVARTSGNGECTGVMMIDVDHFKDYNDKNGHTAGDTALVNVSNRLRNIADTQQGFVGRYGGEEFIFSASDKTPEELKEIAEELRQSIEDMVVETSPTHSDSLTITVGLTSNFLRPTASYEKLIQEADQALYQGKSLGRNRVVLAALNKAQTDKFFESIEPDQSKPKMAPRKKPGSDLLGPEDQSSSS